MKNNHQDFIGLESYLRMMEFSSTRGMNDHFPTFLERFVDSQMSIMFLPVRSKWRKHKHHATNVEGEKNLVMPWVEEYSIRMMFA